MQKKAKLDEVQTLSVPSNLYELLSLIANFVLLSNELIVYKAQIL